MTAMLILNKPAALDRLVFAALRLAVPAPYLRAAAPADAAGATSPARPSILRHAPAYDAVEAVQESLMRAAA